MSQVVLGDDILGKFDKKKDFYLAHFDLRTDVDDVHSIAAIATMLANPKLSEVKFHAIAGAYGRQKGLYVPANKLFKMAFGDKWSDAHADRQKAINEVHKVISETLQSGGTVWISEAGQSDFSAALLRRVKEQNLNKNLKKQVQIVQHSKWNENNTSPKDLDYVKTNATYHKIPDGNAKGNGTPGFKQSSAVDWKSRIKDKELIAIWNEAVSTAKEYNGVQGRYMNKSIKLGGMDFSDVSEATWIFGFNKLKDVNAFFETFKKK